MFCFLANLTVIFVSLRPAVTQATGFFNTD